MANDDHTAQLMKGFAAWNAWRDENPDIRPDLSVADLIGADLSEAVLFRANLSGANLRRANLIRANLIEADLSGANLSGADLRWANLSGADLNGANLSGANLRWAVLIGADLSGANLSGADLQGAALVQTDLTDADLIAPRGCSEPAVVLALGAVVTFGAASAIRNPATGVAILTAVAAATLITLISALFPARKAARLDPAESTRRLLANAVVSSTNDSARSVFQWPWHPPSAHPIGPSPALPCCCGVGGYGYC